LTDAGGGDPLVAHLLPHVVPDAPILALDGSVLFAYDYWDGAAVQLVGTPDRCAALLSAAAPELRGSYAAVPEGTLELVGLDFAPDVSWRFRWTDRRPAIPPPAGGSWLRDADHAEVEELLDSSFPHASARPGNRHARRWAGLRSAEGRLVATAADATESDVGFMASVATHVDHRRTGLGLAMTVWMTHALLDEHPVAALWQYSDNTAATALYDKLGFHDDHRYVGGVLGG
jgi:ribosomal protein S18 acetylase RimI-like enzyme